MKSRRRMKTCLRNWERNPSRTWSPGVRAIGQPKSTRPVSEVIQELAALQYEIESLKKDLDHHLNVVNSYQAKYRTKDDLLLALAEAVRKEKTLADTIGRFAALPEGADNPDAFIRHYEHIQTEVERTRDKRNEGLLRRADLEKEAPDASAEELGRALSEARRTIRVRGQTRREPLKG